MNKYASFLIYSATALLLPIVASAQVGGMEGPGATTSIYSLGLSIVGQLWIVFTVIAIVMFVIAGVLFLTANGESGKITTARSAFLWGVVGIAVGIVAYSITTIVGNLIH